MKTVIRIVAALLVSLGVLFSVPAAPEGAHHMPRPPKAAYEPTYAPVADSKFDAAVAPTEVLRVYMIAVAYNVTTGEIIGGVSAKFPTMAKCKEVAAAPLGEYLPVPPPGHRVYVECKNPSDVPA